MPVRISSFLTKYVFAYISSRLRHLESRMVVVADELQRRGGLHLHVAQLQLAIKAIASFRASVLLRKQKLYQEADSAQRTFLESWLYLMDFTWDPGEAVLEWWRNPTRPLNEKKFQLKQRVQAKFWRNLKLSARQKPSLIARFDDLSNLSVHPTKDAVEKAWRYAADRFGFCNEKESKAQIENLRLLTHSAENFSLVMYLAWFVRFLRFYIFSVEPVSQYFRRRMLFELWLDRWAENAPDYLQTIFNQAEMQYAFEKRQERAAKVANPERREDKPAQL